MVIYGVMEHYYNGEDWEDAYSSDEFIADKNNIVMFFSSKESAWKALLQRRSETIAAAKDKINRQNDIYTKEYGPDWKKDNGELEEKIVADVLQESDYSWHFSFNNGYAIEERGLKIEEAILDDR